ncbi:MAG: VOC family protein [Rhodospirillaceae bacterium]|nr:VOC family protein [Rhodospirillaceae bacterium]
MTADSPSRIQSSETTIDHIGLVGRDIHKMIAAFRHLGFVVTEPAALTQPGPDGEPVSLGQMSAHVIFGDTYIELTAVDRPGQGNHLDPWLARHEGLHIMALRTQDAKQSWDDLAAHGVVMPPMRAASREVNAGGKKGIADFKWFQIPDSISREGFSCVVEHQTPELVFIESLTHHPNGALALRGVCALVDDLNDAVSRYQRLPGANIEPFALGRYVVLKNQRFIAMTPKGMAAMCPGAKLPAPPCFAGFAVHVRSIAETCNYLAQKGIAYQPASELSVWLKPELACGAVLLLIDQQAPI